MALIFFIYDQFFDYLCINKFVYCTAVQFALIVLWCDRLRSCTKSRMVGSKCSLLILFTRSLFPNGTSQYCSARTWFVWF